MTNQKVSQPIVLHEPPDGQGETAEQQNIEAKERVAALPVQPEQKRKSLLRRHPLGSLVAAVLVAAALGAGYYTWKIYFYPYESTDDAFVDARSFAVAAQVQGYVSDVPVTDNQHVNTGDTILQIDPRDFQIALDQANGQIASAKAAINTADAQIAVATAAVDEARAQQNSASAALDFAQQQSTREDELVRSGAGSQQAQQQAASALKQDQAALTQAQASVVSALKNEAAAVAQKESATASLTQAQAAAEEAAQNLKYTRLVAEQPGRVVQLTGSKGQFLDAGQAIAMFVPDDIWVTANFKETQLDDMRPGQPVTLTIDAYPDHVLHGHVASVQPGSGTAFSLLPAQNATGNYVKVTQRIPVKIIVDDWPKDVSIGPGMSVDPTVTVRPVD